MESRVIEILGPCVREKQTQHVGPFPEGSSVSGLHQGSGPICLPPTALSSSSSGPQALPHLVKSPELFDL